MSKICSFFGHRDAPESLRPQMKTEIIRLIEKGVDTFYIGEYGNFDRMSCWVLRELKKIYPHIQIILILSYYRPHKEIFLKVDDTIYPEIESTPPSLAIEARNRWVVDKSDYVIAYVVYGWGGAKKALARAKHQKKKLILL